MRPYQKLLRIPAGLIHVDLRHSASQGGKETPINTIWNLKFLPKTKANYDDQSPLSCRVPITPMKLKSGCV